MNRSPDRMNIDDDVKIKGRGNQEEGGILKRLGGRASEMMDVVSEPVRSIEGWVIIVRGLHEETDEDSLVDKFREYGDVKTVHLNLDRRTGYVKGYAFIEYESRREAEAAVEQANGSRYLGETIKVDYAFVKGPSHDDRSRRDRRRDRSLSPNRR
ncbi:Putative RNA-binding protein 8A [Rhizopus microsporus]|uniref:RNA-binding domain-containing protein n=1 Tax=Rhizopus microsporus TaxID=58291 RepID=A0A0A1N2W9_RHIZD|nr:RNA-binding domain-containing protein [Rhizopus microsporus]CEI86849.1 Putative RNA-binding protein 8A [Rhizopus microsporus]